jgi:hypothetical protein
MAESRHHCITCDKLTNDVYRIKRVHRKTKRLEKRWQCAECWEDEVRRITRDTTHDLAGAESQQRRSIN